MQVGLVSGSTRDTGTTWQVLRKLTERWEVLEPGKFTFLDAPNLATLPLFSPERLTEGRSPVVQTWATFVKTADLLVVATPEYAHNMPAALKSALEWLVASGEFWRKPTLAMTVTPAEPRGEYALKSLGWTLRALEAHVLAEMSCYVTHDAVARAGPDHEWLLLLDAAGELARDLSKPSADVASP